MKTVNIMNFVRGQKPRGERDLTVTIRNELKLIHQYGFENTVLVQYDAMTNPELCKLFDEYMDDKTEYGIWFELCRELVEKAGIRWDGRPGYDWDWYVHPGFLMGYSCEERARLIDITMEKFKETFHQYPKTIGSWLLDSWSMEYMETHYNISTFAICREQYAIDAYTLWGGYYNGGYYPSKYNALCPAQTAENSLKTPVFRLLGPDPIYNYDPKSSKEIPPRNCPTFEAAYVYARDPKIVEWYCRTYFENESLNQAYLQAGQENGFSWENGVGKGLPVQLEILKKWSDSGKVAIKKMCDTGSEFRKRFASTPASSLTALNSWANVDKKSVWYSCKNYRANVICFEGKLIIRDIHKFDENYCERYIDKPCLDKDAIYDTLPIIDGFCWKQSNELAGLYLGENQEKFEVTGHEDTLRICSDNVTIYMQEGKLIIETSEKVILNLPNSLDTTLDYSNGVLYGCHNGYNYRIFVEAAVEKQTDKLIFIPQNGKLIFHF